jgi:hypothetical protein
MAGKGWQREFEDPIPLPGGRMIVTLEDAARYIQKLPRADQDLPHWQTATLTLINTAEGPQLPVSCQCGHAAGVEPRQGSTTNSTTTQGPRRLTRSQMNRIGRRGLRACGAR